MALRCFFGTSARDHKTETILGQAVSANPQRNRPAANELSAFKDVGRDQSPRQPKFSRKHAFFIITARWPGVCALSSGAFSKSPVLRHPPFARESHGVFFFLVF